MSSEAVRGGRLQERIVRFSALLITLSTISSLVGCGQSSTEQQASSAKVTLQGIVSVAIEYGGIGPNGIELNNPMVIMSTSGASYQLQLAEDPNRQIHS